MTNVEFERLVDVDEAAALLATSSRHIKRLVYERRIPYVKVGRWVRFRPSDLSAWVKDQLVAPSTSMSLPGKRMTG